MRISTLLVLLVATFSFSCFKFCHATSEVEVPVGATWATKVEEVFQGVAKLDPILIDRVKAAHLKMDEAARTHVVDFEHIANELHRLFALDKGKQWTEADAEARLEKYLENINEADWLTKTPHGMKLKQLAEKTAKITAKRSSKWTFVRKSLKTLVIGAIAGLILAAIYGMWQ